MTCYRYAADLEPVDYAPGRDIEFLPAGDDTKDWRRGTVTGHLVSAGLDASKRDAVPTFDTAAQKVVYPRVKHLRVAVTR